uniref:Uncharacterized protein n=1 Tax=Parascaris equorum TaxID=6256 RepID=A0A914RFC3_PAREQ
MSGALRDDLLKVTIRTTHSPMTTTFSSDKHLTDTLTRTRICIHAKRLAKLSRSRQGDKSVQARVVLMFAHVRTSTVRLFARVCGRP